MSIFIRFPWIALLVAAMFGLLWALRRLSAIAVAAILWALYALYEFLISFRILCSGECNIRVDLLLIYPLLAIATVIALSAAIRATPKNTKRRGS
jgi:hypothetical protein